MAFIPVDENRITYFAETDARNKRVKFGIKAKDRTKHVYVIGKTGMGKSTMLENMAVQDIQNGEGMAFIDPHGKTADLLLEYVPKERINDVIYIAPFDVEHPISFNVLENVDDDKKHLVVSGLMSTFKKIWVDAWSARMEYMLTNTLLALMDHPGSTLLGVNRMLSDKAYRADVVSTIKDPSVKAFWVKEFANYTERQAAEAVPAIQNKVGQFTANPLIRNMLGQAKSSFNFREAMDSRKIIIINLSKGRIGDENMKLLGGLLVTKIYLAAMSRADVPDRVMKVLPNFYLFVDEFQNFANASFADILSEARKYKLNLTIAHQYVEQMDEIVRPAVFGNVGTMIMFRIGANDAEALENEFAPQFTVEDLVNLGAYQIYLKLMINGLTSSPFSATTLDAIPHPDTSYVKDIIDSSRRQFAIPRATVEADIVKFHEATVPAKKIAVPVLAPTPVGVPVVAVKPSPVSSVPIVSTISKSAQPSPVSSPKPLAPIIKKSVEPVPTPTHQPFKKAFTEVVKLAPVEPKSVEIKITDPIQKPITPIVQKTEILKTILSTQSTSVIQKNPEPPEVTKPISLSALVPRPVISTSSKVFNDPKGQSPQNVSDLKNALAAVLNKNKPAAPSVPPVLSSNNIPAKPLEIKREEISQQKSSAVPQKIPESQVKSVEPQTPTTQVAPKEVPEEVLKKVLHIEQ